MPRWWASINGSLACLLAIVTLRTVDTLTLFAPVVTGSVVHTPKCLWGRRPQRRKRRWSKTQNDRDDNLGEDDVDERLLSGEMGSGQQYTCPLLQHECKNEHDYVLKEHLCRCPLSLTHLIVVTADKSELYHLKLKDLNFLYAQSSKWLTV